MIRNAYTFAFLTVFVLVAVFGMPLILSTPMHHGGCPFMSMSDQPIICSAETLLHMKHWQSAFATVLAEILVLVALVLLFFRKPFSALIDTGQMRWRAQRRTPKRPTLFQELFMRGILNRKEPHLFLVTY